MGSPFSLFVLAFVIVQRFNDCALCFYNIVNHFFHPVTQHIKGIHIFTSSPTCQSGSNTPTLAIIVSKHRFSKLLTIHLQNNSAFSRHTHFTECLLKCLHHCWKRSLNVRPLFLVTQHSQKFPVWRDDRPLGKAGYLYFVNGWNIDSKRFSADSENPIRNFKVNFI